MGSCPREKIGRNTHVPVWCAWNAMKYMKGHIKKKKQAEGFHCNIPYEKNVVYWVTCARRALLVARSRLYAQAHSVTCRLPCVAAVPANSRASPFNRDPNPRRQNNIMLVQYYYY